MLRTEELVHPGEGDEELSDIRDNDPHADRGHKRKSKRSRTSPAAAGKAGDVGKALRSVYDSTLREEVPSDFLDLLGKLR